MFTGGPILSLFGNVSQPIHARTTFIHFNKHSFLHDRARPDCAPNWILYISYYRPRYIWWLFIFLNWSLFSTHNVPMCSTEWQSIIRCEWGYMVQIVHVCVCVWPRTSFNSPNTLLMADMRVKESLFGVAYIRRGGSQNWLLFLVEIVDMWDSFSPKCFIGGICYFLVLYDFLLLLNTEIYVLKCKTNLRSVATSKI